MKHLVKFTSAISGILFFLSFWPSSPDAQRERFAIWIIFTVISVFVLLIIWGIKGLFEEVTTYHLISPDAFWQNKLEYFRYDKVTMNPYRCDIELPTPYHPLYHGDMSVWTSAGYWQNEWRAYQKGLPCVYNDPNILPPKYSWQYPNLIKFWFYDPNQGRILAHKN